MDHSLDKNGSQFPEPSDNPYGYFTSGGNNETATKDTDDIIAVSNIPLPYSENNGNDLNQYSASYGHNYLATYDTPDEGRWVRGETSSTNEPESLPAVLKDSLQHLNIVSSNPVQVLDNEQKNDTKIDNDQLGSNDLFTKIKETLHFLKEQPVVSTSKAGSIASEDEGKADEEKFNVPREIWNAEMVDLFTRRKQLDKKCAKKKNLKTRTESRILRSKFRALYRIAKEEMAKRDDFEELKEKGIKEKAQAIEDKRLRVIRQEEIEKAAKINRLAANKPIHNRGTLQNHPPIYNPEHITNSFIKRKAEEVNRKVFAGPSNSFANFNGMKKVFNSCYNDGQQQGWNSYDCQQSWNNNDGQGWNNNYNGGQQGWNNNNNGGQQGWNNNNNGGQQGWNNNGGRQGWNNNGQGWNNNNGGKPGWNNNSGRSWNNNNGPGGSFCRQDRNFESFEEKDNQRSFQGPSRGFQGPSRGFQGPSRGFQGPSREFQGLSREFQGPSGEYQGPPEGFQGPMGGRGQFGAMRGNGPHGGFGPMRGNGPQGGFGFMQGNGSQCGSGPMRGGGLQGGYGPMGGNCPPGGSGQSGPMGGNDPQGQSGYMGGNVPKSRAARRRKNALLRRSDPMSGNGIQGGITPKSGAEGLMGDRPTALGLGPISLIKGQGLMGDRPVFCNAQMIGGFVPSVAGTGRFPLTVQKVRKKKNGKKSNKSCGEEEGDEADQADFDWEAESYSLIEHEDDDDSDDGEVEMNEDGKEITSDNEQPENTEDDSPLYEGVETGFPYVPVQKNLFAGGSQRPYASLGGPMKMDTEITPKQRRFRPQRERLSSLIKAEKNYCRGTGLAFIYSNASKAYKPTSMPAFKRGHKMLSYTIKGLRKTDDEDSEITQEDRIDIVSRRCLEAMMDSDEDELQNGVVRLKIQRFLSGMHVVPPVYNPFGKTLESPTQFTVEDCCGITDNF